MTFPAFDPVLALTRAGLIESVHRGAIAVVDPTGRLLYHYGDPTAKVYLRSSAKPFQALPLVESGAMQAFGLTARELALACASHKGLDIHAEALAAMQAKIGISEADLQCGTHPYEDPATAKALIRAGIDPSANRHNCSGKHTGMLAAAKHLGQPLDTYLEVTHPLQQRILSAFAAMTDTPREQIIVGIDGCSAPNFAVPLAQAATALARLADPTHAPAQHAEALSAIFNAMHAHPDMVRGPKGYDTELMKLGQGRWVAKGGAEGYEAIAIAPGVIAPHAVGIALKIHDGAARAVAVALVATAVLHQLGALTEIELEHLSHDGFALPQPVTNWRGIEVGEVQALFELVTD